MHLVGRELEQNGRFGTRLQQSGAYLRVDLEIEHQSSPFGPQHRGQTRVRRIALAGQHPVRRQLGAVRRSPSHGREAGQKIPLATAIFLRRTGRDQEEGKGDRGSHVR